MAEGTSETGGAEIGEDLDRNIGLLDAIGIGTMLAARGEPQEAKAALVSMDEIGAHLSARLLRRAERMIDDAAEKTDQSSLAASTRRSERGPSFSTSGSRSRR